MSNAAAFKIELEREWAETEADMQKAVREVTLFALQSVIRMSPVDTGRFKGNWFPSIGSISNETTEKVDPSGADAMARGLRELTSYPKDGRFPKIYLQNNLPYALRLENGYSKQAPNGMVGVTVVNVNAQYGRIEL